MLKPPAKNRKTWLMMLGNKYDNLPSNAKALTEKLIAAHAATLNKPGATSNNEPATSDPPVLKLIRRQHPQSRRIN